MFVFEYITSKVLDEAFSKIKKIYSDNNQNVKIKKNDIENSINIHLKYVNNLSELISFKDLQNKKALKNTFIDLNLYLTPLKDQVTNIEKEKSVSLNEVLENESNHTIILGQVGAGKTTAMKNVCQRCLFDEKFKKGYSFPIFIELKDLKNEKESLIKYILEILGVVIENKKEITLNEFYNKVCITLLDTLSPILILDGFDEVDIDLRERVGNEVRKLCLSLNNSFIFLTSRTTDFNVDIENATYYEISTLSSFQISNFVKNWFQSDIEAEEFLFQLFNSPYKDFALRPLNLAHICAIYERGDKKIPEPKTIYSKIINLLLKEWDQQRSLNRKNKFFSFPPEKKREFLSTLSFGLSIKIKKTSSSYDNYDLADIFMANLEDKFKIKFEELENILQELESQNGILIKTSYIDYGFSHKSIREFLCAEYIIDLPEIPTNLDLLMRVPNEMALAVSLAKNPALYFSSLILDVIFPKWLNTRDIKQIPNKEKLYIQNIYENFLRTFHNRLLIEKIEFNSSPLIGIIYLYIKTVYKAVPHREFIFDKMLADNITVKNSFKDLTSYYYLSLNARVGKKQLIKKDLSKVDSIVVPKYLDFDESLLELCNFPIRS